MRRANSAGKLFSLLSAGLFLFPFISRAQEDFLNPDIQQTSIPTFISDFYVFALAIGGIIAVGAIVVGGVMYISEGAIPQKKTEGKTIILGALWGLGLLLGAYVILRTVNPELVTLDVGELDQAHFENSCTASSTVQYIGGVRIVKQLERCKESPLEWPRGADGKCSCYTDKVWEERFEFIVSGHNDLNDDVNTTGEPVTIQGCENPYKNICGQYGGTYQESVALQCKALGDAVPQGLIKSDYGGYVNPTVYENYKKALDCVVAAHPELKKSDFSFNSGWRSPAAQYVTYKNARPGYAAKPCCSNHGAGCALDIRYKGATIKDWGFSDGKLKDCMNKFGLKAELRSSPNEPWHYSPTGR